MRKREYNPANITRLLRERDAQDAEIKRLKEVIARLRNGARGFTHLEKQANDKGIQHAA